MKRLLILNGTIITPETTLREDLLIKDEKIIARGKINPEYYPNSETLDATGKLIFPGGVDPHVHLALPTPAGKSSDDFLSGTRAAIAGGTTSIIDFVTPRRGQSLIEALDQRREEAEFSICDYRLHMGISEWNSRVADEVGQCMKEEGIGSFKVYLAYRDTIGIGLTQLRQLMERISPEGGLVMVHCEDGEMIDFLQIGFIHEGKTDARYHAQSRPPQAEINSIKEVITIAEQTGCRTYIVHTSTAGGAEAIRQSKEKGIKVYGETCPQYLLLNDSVYDSRLENTKVLPYVISPPIRLKSDQQQLWKSLSNGTFDVVSTDHCPFNLAGQKDRGINDFTKIPNGAGGIEHRLSLLYTYGVLTNKITINQLVELISTHPAEIFGWGNRKGKIEPGFDADIVIWDPGYKGTISVKNHFQHCDSEIYEGFEIQGRPETVIVRGKIVSRSGRQAYEVFHRDF